MSKQPHKQSCEVLIRTHDTILLAYQLKFKTINGPQDGITNLQISPQCSKKVKDTPLSFASDG